MKIKQEKQKVLIVGSGVIGAYLSKLLLSKKKHVIVSTRQKAGYQKNYQFLKIHKKVKFVKLNILKKNDIKKLLFKYRPKIIFYLAGISSVPKSYSNASETINSLFTGAKLFLKVIKEKKIKTKFFKANSGYIFKGGKGKISLRSKLNTPDSPYVLAQMKSFKLVKKYQKRGVECYSGIFFNIESPLRPNNFLVKKVCQKVKAIKSNPKLKLKVGNINAVRDFGWITEMVKAAYLMTKLKPCSMIIGTGKSTSVREIIKYAFKYYKINYKDHILIEKKYLRKKEQNVIVADIKDTVKKLKRWSWKPKIFGKKIVYKMLKSI